MAPPPKSCHREVFLANTLENLRKKKLRTPKCFILFIYIYHPSEGDNASPAKFICGPLGNLETFQLDAAKCPG